MADERFDAPTDLLTLSIDDSTENGRRWVDMIRPVVSTETASAHYVMRDGAAFSCPYYDVYDGFSEDAAPIYSSGPGLMRHEPILIYDGTEARTICVVIHLLAQDSMVGIEAETLLPFHWLSALNLPFYGEDQYRHSPPPVIVTIGNILRMRAVVENVGTRWSGPWSKRGDNIYPEGADVSLHLTSVAPGFQNYGLSGGFTRRTQTATRGGVFL